MARKNNTPNNPRGLRHVLVSRFSALGDVAMTVPVLYSAARCYPGVEFYLITRPSMTSIFVNPPANLHLIGVDVKNEYQGIRGMNRLLGELVKKYGIDGYVDLHAVLRTFALAACCHLRGIPVSVIHKGRRGKWALTRKRNKVMLPLISSRARYREAFFGIGLPLQERFDGLYGMGKGDPELFASITPAKKDRDRWVAIAPFAKHPGKIYPPEMMEMVVKELSNDKHVKIFLFGGGPEEKAVFDQWVAKYPRVVSLANEKHGFAVELALLSWMDAAVTMDSANMHLASLVNIPVISIWGATHPYCGFKGWRQQEKNTVQLPMTCRPCSVFGNAPCHRGDYYCLRGIAPTVILQKLQPYIK
ncbi:MAG: glycosyltransferase family 9 protein [Bacteroidales bacterium]|nr:glycosyltransferase family 9 protein [Bacteroidales bacterium]MCD8393212.1 glycosyltransferase family 9 protein [Bacteroidales bacterium]